MISFIAYLEIINVVLSDPIISLSVAASAADATAFNPGDTKTLLSNGLSTFSIKGNPVLVMVLKVYLKILLIALFFM